jgi:hypothetical protein
MTLLEEIGKLLSRRTQAGRSVFLVHAKIIIKLPNFEVRFYKVFSGEPSKVQAQA